MSTPDAPSNPDNSKKKPPTFSTLTQDQVRNLLNEVKQNKLRHEQIAGAVSQEGVSPVEQSQREIDTIKENRRNRENLTLIQTNTPAVKKLADFSTTFSGYKSVTTTMDGKPAITSWKNLVANPKAVETVRGSMQAEKEAIQQAKSGIVIADMYKPRGDARMSLDQRTEGVLRREDNRFVLRNEQNEQMDASQERKKALSETDELIRRLEERNKARNQAGTVVRQSTEVAPLTRVTAPIQSAQEDVTLAPVSLDGKASLDSARFLYQEEIEKAGKNMERVHTLLEKRKKKGIASLLEKGFKGLPKALEVFSGVKPRYKIAMGIALAGASVATGGLTSILSTGLSTLSYSSGFYKKMIDAEMKKNPNVNKSFVAVRALGYGLVTALASGVLLSNIFSSVDMPEVIDGAVAKVESAKDSVSGWFKSLFASPDAVYTGPVGDGINGLDLPYEPINGLDLPSEPNIAHLDGVVTGEGVPQNLRTGGQFSPGTTVQTPPSSVEMVTSPAVEDNLDGVVFAEGSPSNAIATPDHLDGVVTGEGVPNNIAYAPDNLDGAVTGQGTPHNLQDGVLRDSSGNPVRSGSGGVVQSGGFISDNHQ